jgi:putative endonuclease
MAPFTSAPRPIFLVAPGNIDPGIADSFTKQYGLRRLVYAEGHDDILAAKQRERNIKHWKRAWKVQLILRDNPNWEDLYDRLA